MQILKREVRQVVQLALKEDHVHNDITSQACISSEKSVCADIVLKQNAKVAGLPFLPWMCEMIDPSLQCQIHVCEGSNYSSGTVIASIQGKAHFILAGERTILNVLQHTSGVAHLTSQYVEAIKKYNCEILDTRKTLPGLRAIQKYAVAIGGGKNHRFHLEDRVLIKNNHLNLLKKDSPTPILDAIHSAKNRHPKAKIEVEVETLAALEEALKGKADMILLDNMPVSVVEKAVAIAKGKVYLEASGGITLVNIKNYAATGVNGISIGALTHSACAVDMSLRLL